VATGADVRFGLVVGDVGVAFHAGVTVCSDARLVNVVAGRAVGVAGTLGVVGDAVEAGELAGRVAVVAVRCGIDRCDVWLVAGRAFTMSLRACRKDLFVTAGAGYR